ncbi:hypothetical protein [Rhizobiales bacterium]|uniref:hypothetical protein n=1 Tax=Ensifer adhaerens TaxID=106592 RepID=UPI0013AFF895
MGEKAAIFNPLFHYSLLKLTIPFLEIPPWLCRRFRLALANIDALRTADAGIGVGYERNKYGKAKACRAPVSRHRRTATRLCRFRATTPGGNIRPMLRLISPDKKSTPATGSPLESGRRRLGGTTGRCHSLFLAIAHLRILDL